MNGKHTKITTGLAALVAVGLMGLAPLHANAANRPSPDANGTPATAQVVPRQSSGVMCPAADLVPECPTHSGGGDGPGTHPQVVPAVDVGGGSGSALLSLDRSMPSPN
jgi:hypothetical protein